MSPKLVSAQRPLHIQFQFQFAEKKYACTHMLRSVCANPRCISRSSSAHARTNLEARVHAHRADRAPKYAKIRELKFMQTFGFWFLVCYTATQ